MATPDDRRDAHIRAMSVNPLGDLQDAGRYDRLLAHFEETGQRTVAEAIKFGVRAFDAHGYATSQDDSDATTFVVGEDG